MFFYVRSILLKKINIRLNTLYLISLIIISLTIYSFITRSCSATEEILMNKSQYRLIVIILTSPDNMKHRDTIRKTWISERNENIKHLFAIGTFDIQIGQRDTLKSEQRKYNDLLLLPKLQDSYDTLTKKVLQSFQEVYKTYKFDYLLKCDDDSYVFLHQIMLNLDLWENKKTEKELYWGFFNGRAHVKRSGPWREPDWNICDYYLPYAVGGGYVLSYNLIKFIALNADSLRLFNAEDVSVGLWLAPVANIEKKHEIRFDTEYHSRGCSNQYIITHKQEPGIMNSIHEHYMSTGTLCTTEIRTRMGYQYNWTVPPSQCCQRQAGII